MVTKDALPHLLLGGAAARGSRRAGRSDTSHAHLMEKQEVHSPPLQLQGWHCAVCASGQERATACRGKAGSQAQAPEASGPVRRGKRHSHTYSRDKLLSQATLNC